MIHPRVKRWAVIIQTCGSVMLWTRQNRCIPWGMKTVEINIDDLDIAIFGPGIEIEIDSGVAFAGDRGGYLRARSDGRSGPAALLLA